MIGYRLLLALLLGSAISGCSRNPPPADRVAAVVMEAPPESPTERTGNRPRDNYVWVAGYWNLVRNRFVWVPGFWTIPPQGFSAWEAARWERSDQGWMLIRGRWR